MQRGCDASKDETANFHMEEREQSFFDFAVDLLFLLRTAHPYLAPMALEYLGSDMLCEKIPRRWQVKLDETHQKKPEMATFTHDREECLHWELVEATQRDKKQLDVEYVDSFANRKKKFDGKRNGPKGQTNFRNEEQGGWNKLTVQVHEVQQQSDDTAQPQKKQSHHQKNKTPSTFAQSAFSGGPEEKSQSGPQNEGTSNSGPCYNCGEEGQ